MLLLLFVFINVMCMHSVVYVVAGVYVNVYIVVTSYGCCVISYVGGVAVVFIAVGVCVFAWLLCMLYLGIPVLMVSRCVLVLLLLRDGVCCLRCCVCVWCVLSGVR